MILVIDQWTAKKGSRLKQQTLFINIEGIALGYLQDDVLCILRGEFMPKISVIMPSYQVANYIEEALSSVLNQDIEDIEILAVDAFSTDGTREKIESFAKKDSRIRLLDDIAGSTGYSNNLGIREAQGKYIGIVETDDYIKPGMLSRLFEVAESNDVDYVKADYQAFWTTGNGKRVFRTRKNTPDNGFYGHIIRPSMHPLFATSDWYQWTGIYNKEFLRKKAILYNETKGAAFQDIGFLHQTTALAERAIYIPDTYYCYRLDRTGASSNAGKDLRNIYQEYSRLLSLGNDMLYEPTARIMYYARMSKSYISCYHGFPTGSSLPIDELDLYDAWFREKLNGAIDDGTLDERVLPEGIWMRLKKLLSTYGSYSEWLHEKTEVVRILTRNSEKVIIFGCGDYGYDSSRVLKQLNVNVTFFMDNDMSLWGKMIDNIKVLNPKEAMQQKDAIYIVANAVHYQDIESQLIGYGIKKENILFYE